MSISMPVGLSMASRRRQPEQVTRSSRRALLLDPAADAAALGREADTVVGASLPGGGRAPPGLDHCSGADPMQIYGEANLQ